MVHSLAAATRERFYSAGLRRLRGELLMHTPEPEDRGQAEASFHAGIKVAAQQGAVALEHKARASLGRQCE